MFFYLVTVFLSISSVSSCPSFTSSVEEGRAVCPGEELTYTCTVFDDTSSFPPATWSGFCTDGSDINIAHGIPALESGTCGPFTVQATGSDGDCHTSTLTVTASPELNGTVIQCSGVSDDVGRATLLVADETGVSGLVVTPTYEKSSLKTIDSVWNAICLKYYVTVTCGKTNLDTSIISFAECLGGTCVSEVDDITVDTGDECTVSVVAGALRGQRNFSMNNNLLEVTLSDDKSPTTVTYSFLSGFFGEACFHIEFNYTLNQSSVVNTTETSFVCRGSGERLEEFLPPITDYNYIASAVECGACERDQFQSVIVLGSGTTGMYEFGSCSATHLFGGNIYQICPCTGDDAGCVVDYADLTPGYMASYMCCDGYELEGSSTLQCQPNGVWNGNPPACLPVVNPFTTPFIIVIVIAAILLVTAIIFMVLFVIYCWKAQNQAKVSGGQRLGSPSEMKAL